MAKQDTRPTIRHVAALAEVSLGTVSRVLNNHNSVKPAIRKKVLEAIDQLGFKPDAIAQSMRVGSTRTIGCILRDLTIPPLMAFISAAHDTLDAAGFSLLISNTEGREERERTLLSSLSRRRIDGIIFGNYTPIVGEFRDFLLELNVPIVLFDRNEASFDAVIVDHRAGVFQATKSLLELGHRRIALITGDQHLYLARERLQGYQEAFAEMGLSPDPSLLSSKSFLASAAYDVATDMLQRPEPPTAILAGGMDMLSGVLRAVHDRGLRIPEDISVIGAANSDLAELHSPPIAMIDWDYAKVGRLAATLLLDRINGTAESEARHVIVPTHYIARPSIGAPRAAEPAKSKRKAAKPKKDAAAAV
ncbi:LacI family DNA-binding transcriptional regulator [Sphingobium sp. SA916]|uniref:LacI family DNA-binding transcriptional regulator n=1 Tax=Sphingobium sp. SA916 TaxID=1851207 RepID=UPI001C0EBCE2|nr:LacI family DNA-binding transcriptional regulator [Sphingobium sp. SA916]